MIEIKIWIIGNKISVNLINVIKNNQFSNNEIVLFGEFQSNSNIYENSRTNVSVPFGKKVFFFFRVLTDYILSPNTLPGMCPVIFLTKRKP